MASESNASNSPIPLKDLTGIATEACDSTLQSAKSYDHTLVADWNSQIINKVLTSLIQSTSTSSTTTPKPSSENTSSTQPPSPTTYRFNVNSTIVQQSPPPPPPPTSDATADQQQPADSNGVDTAPSTTSTSTSTPPSTGRRGMHSASGAYWDVKRDGMWTFKYEGAEEKGMDVVLSVIWFAMG